MSTINYYGSLFAGAKITPAITRASNNTRAFALMSIKNRTPVDTGRLKQSWAVGLEGHGLRITNTAPYSIFVEMGFKHYRSGKLIPPKNMIRDALPGIKETFKKELKKELGLKEANKVIGSEKAVTVPSYQDYIASQGSKFSFGFR